MNRFSNIFRIVD